MKKRNWEDSPFNEDLLYVVDGELLNHILKVMRAFKIAPDLNMTLPHFNGVLNYMIKSIIQCSNYPTGESVTDLQDFDVDMDEIEFENWLWECGIKLPNPEDPNNQYPEEDQ